MAAGATHVIADADEIKIILTEEDADKDGIDAKVVGGDAEADVAVLKIKTSRKLKAVITDPRLITPTGKFNVNNTQHDVY